MKRNLIYKIWKEIKYKFDGLSLSLKEGVDFFRMYPSPEGVRLIMGWEGRERYLWIWMDSVFDEVQDALQKKGVTITLSGPQEITTYLSENECLIDDIQPGEYRVFFGKRVYFAIKSGFGSQEHAELLAIARGGKKDKIEEEIEREKRERARKVLLDNCVSKNSINEEAPWIYARSERDIRLVFTIKSSPPSDIKKVILILGKWDEEVGIEFENYELHPLSDGKIKIELPIQELLSSEDVPEGLAYVNPEAVTLGWIER